MSRRSRVALCLIVLGLYPLFAQTSHLVQKGDTVYAIAKKYGVSVDSVLKANDIDDPLKIAVGRRLAIPAASAPAAAQSAPSLPAAPAPIKHRVLKGETLYGIARRYGVSVDDLRTANGLSASGVLKESATLIVPGPSSSGVAVADSGPTAAEGGATGGTAIAVAVGAANGAAAPGAAFSSGSANLSGTAPAEAAAGRGGLHPVGTKTADAALRWPIAAKEVAYLEGKLYGVWILGERSEPVVALKAGTVAAAGPYRGFGQVVIVRTKDGLAYVYGGCESLSVAIGDSVAGGSALGKLGLDQLTGDSRLFFFVYDDNAAVDPATAPRDL